MPANLESLRSSSGEFACLAAIVENIIPTVEALCPEQVFQQAMNYAAEIANNELRRGKVHPGLVPQIVLEKTIFQKAPAGSSRPILR